MKNLSLSGKTCLPDIFIVYYLFSHDLTESLLSHWYPGIDTINLLTLTVVSGTIYDVNQVRLTHIYFLLVCLI